MATKPSIAQLRPRIAELQSELAALQASGASHAEVCAGIDAFCRGAAARGDQTLGYAVISGTLGEGLTIRPGPGGVVDLAPVLASVLGADGLATALQRHVRLMEDGPSVAERAARLAEISAELDRHERDEETLIEASEATATPIARRADARPEIVLGVRA